MPSVPKPPELPNWLPVAIALFAIGLQLTGQVEPIAGYSLMALAVSGSIAWLLLTKYSGISGGEVELVETELSESFHEAAIFLTIEPFWVAVLTALWPGWWAKVSAFIGSTLGPVAQARFGSDGREPQDLQASAELARKCLIELADNLTREKIRIGGVDLKQAAESRRENKIAKYRVPRKGPL